MLPKIAFYPCCLHDFSEPMQILKELVDIIYFCDIHKYKEFDEFISMQSYLNPNVIFMHGDARKVIKDINQIDVLFYRRDSSGEGGSGLFVLGDSFLPFILERYNPNGGKIITDGSNSRGGIYKKMKRRSGFKKYGWHILLSNEQRFLKDHNLYTFDVLPQT